MTQDAVHLGQSAGQVLEVADAESAGDGGEGTLSEGQLFGVAFEHREVTSGEAGGDLFASDAEHAGREIDPRDGGSGEGTADGDRQVAGSGGHVEHAVRSLPAEHLHHAAAPPSVDVHREQVVEQVVAAGDRVEHLAHLLFFTGGVFVVWFYHWNRIDLSGVIRAMMAVGSTMDRVMTASVPRFSATTCSQSIRTGTAAIM